jgi:hypothetical protein
MRWMRRTAFPVWTRPRRVSASVAQLFEATERDFVPVYRRVATLPEIAPDLILPADRVIARGTGSWKRRRAA